MYKKKLYKYEKKLANLKSQLLMRGGVLTDDIIMELTTGISESEKFIITIADKDTQFNDNDIDNIIVSCKKIIDNKLIIEKNKMEIEYNVIIDILIHYIDRTSLLKKFINDTYEPIIKARKINVTDANKIIIIIAKIANILVKYYEMLDDIFNKMDTMITGTNIYNDLSNFNSNTYFYFLSLVQDILIPEFNKLLQLKDYLNYFGIQINYSYFAAIFSKIKTKTELILNKLNSINKKIEAYKFDDDIKGYFSNFTVKYIIYYIKISILDNYTLFDKHPQIELILKNELEHKDDTIENIMKKINLYFYDTYYYDTYDCDTY